MVHGATEVQSFLKILQHGLDNIVYVARVDAGCTGLVQVRHYSALALFRFQLKERPLQASSTAGGSKCNRHQT
eukprot:scaffold203572_cov28-Tisochrysis_lutea.AAC.2